MVMAERGKSSSVTISLFGISYLFALLKNLLPFELQAGPESEY